MWGFWWGQETLLGDGDSITFTPDVYYPEGYFIAADAQAPWWSLPAAPITALLGPLLTYNLLVLTVTFAAGIGVYFLVEQLTQQRWAGVLSAAIYMTAPLITMRMGGHFNLLLAVMSLPYLVLALYRALSAENDKRALIYSILAGLFQALATISSWYFLFIGFLPLISLLITSPKPISLAIKLRRLTVTLIVWFLLTLPFILITLDANSAMYGQTATFNLAGTDSNSISLDRLFVPNPFHAI